ncbi:hypothetical protein TIFTF001_039448 [Ficus carica]|uniref:Uncharacterized protein n=1 Tax=Ficus carica TaxID=3494 RepID=A0AA88E972_FICCA|nr:hypothetical protein TIFTF001_039448 [Ficus carica]
MSSLTGFKTIGGNNGEGVFRLYKTISAYRVINHVALTVCTGTSPIYCSGTTVSTLVATSSDTSSSVATSPSTPNERYTETNDMFYSDSECNSGNEELSDNEIEKAYEKIYFKWVQLCKLNKKLEDHVIESVNERDSLKKAVVNYEIQVTEKDKKL